MTHRQKAALEWNAPLIGRVAVGVVLLAAGYRSSNGRDLLDGAAAVGLIAVPLALPLALSGGRELSPSTPIAAAVRRLRAAGALLLFASVAVAATGRVDTRWLALPLAIGGAAFVVADHREAGAPPGAWRDVPPHHPAIRGAAWVAAFAFCGVLAFRYGLWRYG